MPLAAMFADIAECYDLEVFQHLLLHQLKRSLRYSEFFSLLLLSVDREENEGWGGAAGQGNKLLALTFENIRQELRDTDFIGRYGDELGMVLLNSAEEGGRAAAERIHERIGGFLFPVELTGGQAQVTVSVGGASFPADARDLPTLLQRALLALGRAREAGGNRVGMYGELAGGG